MATSLLRMFQSCIYGGVVLRDQMFVVFDGLLREKNPELHDALFKLNSGEQSMSGTDVVLRDS